MTEKEEAIELVNKFKIKVTVVYSEDSVPCVLNAPIIEKSAKQCALISVDNKIISIRKFKHPTNSHAMNRRVDREIKRLEEVKQEINKL